MPLPASNAEWPPPEWVEHQRLITEAKLWLTGNLPDLASFQAQSHTTTPSGWRARLLRLAMRGSDSDNTAAALANRLHVPLSRMVARTSAALLFSEEPALQIPEAHAEVERGENGTPQLTEEQATAQATEDRLAWLIEDDGWAAKLLQAAYVASGTGGVYLRPVWGVAGLDRPTLTVVHHDCAVPRFEFDQLVEVIFTRTLETEAGGRVWRHLELHAPGRIEHAVYVGTAKRLGERKGLKDHAATARLDGDEINLTERFGIEGLLPDYVPNWLPNVVTLSSTIGSADCAGIEDQMFALDTADTEWHADVRLGKRRIIVGEHMLTRGGRGEGAVFDVDQEVFAPVHINPVADEQTIEMVDFDIRAADFEATLTNRLNRGSLAAGYNAESVVWANTGQAMTATEVLSRDALSADTTAAKRRWWGTAIANQAEKFLRLDRELTRSGVEPMRPRVVWPTAGERDLRETAQAVVALRTADAVSIEEAVRMVHPEWDQPTIDAEVERIQGERGRFVDDPTGGFPG